MQYLDPAEVERLRARHPFLASWLLDEDCSADVWCADEERQRRLQPQQHLIPHFERYFECRLHDSTIAAAELTVTALTLRLADVSVTDFARVCLEMPELATGEAPEKLPPFPVQLTFAQPTVLGAYCADDSGNVWVPEVNAVLVDARDYLYDSFETITQTQVRLGLGLWLRHQSRGHACLLELECTRVGLSEGQRTVFANLLGPPALPLFDHFMQLNRPDVGTPKTWRAFYNSYVAAHGTEPGP